MHIYNNDISQFKVAGFASKDDFDAIDYNGYELKRNTISGTKRTVGSSSYYGILLTNGYNNIVEDNEININSTVNGNLYGMYDQTGGYGTYKNNYIGVMGTGIKIINGYNFSIINNTVFSTSGRGIDVSAAIINLTNNEIASYKDDCINATGNVTAINNSTFLYNSSTGSAFRATTGTKIVNNSFFNSSTNANTSAINLGSAATCDYNNLYSLSSTLGIYNAVARSSFNIWRVSTFKDSHSISADPLYSDPELCSMQINLSSPLVNRALASEMPSYDITGEARDYNAIGAWDPYPHTSWYTRSARQRAYDIRNAMRESMEMQSLLDEQNAETANIESPQYSINYSSGLLNVISSEKEDATYTLYIADMLTGETRMQTPIVLVDGVSQSVDLSTLAPGYYVVKLVTGVDTYSWKIRK